MNSQTVMDTLQLLNLFPTAARTATANGTGIDLNDYEGDVAIILDSAAGTGTTPTLDVKIQDSADNSTFADVSGATFTQLTTTAGREKIVINSNSTARYVRAVATIAGTSPSFTFSVNAVGIKKYPA